MLSSAVARRYAQALFSLARDRGVLDEVERELGAAARAVEENADLKSVLEHRLIPPRTKKQVLGSLIEGKVSRITANFLYLVIDKQRERHLGAIAREYIRMADAARKTREVQVTSAHPLSDSELRSIRCALEAKYGTAVKIVTAVDPAILGGVVVKIDDQLLDGSLRGRLERLRARLVEGDATMNGVNES